MTKLYIFYGSATGNAEQIAKDLSCKKLAAPFESVVCEPLEKYRKYTDEWLKEPTLDTQAKHGVVIVTSTTGNGDAPENASRFVRYIKRKTTVDSRPFQHVAFTILGLGDTNYDNFCQTAKVVDTKLPELGGTRAKDLACADEATGLEDVVEPWTDTFMNDITKACFPDFANNSSSNDTPQVVEEPKSTKVQPKTQSPKANTAAVSKAQTTEQKPSPSVSNKDCISESPLFILYGSATGNAEHIAKELTSTYEMILQNPDAKLFFKSVVCCELDQFKKKCQDTWEKQPPEGMKHGLLVVCSTTGNGDAPENAGRFVRYIKRKTTVNSMPFRNVSFSVLGLGDTNYDQFCNSGKEIDKKLAELGGTRIQPVACADEATGLEDVVEPWTNSIFDKITRACKPSMEEEDSNNRRNPAKAVPKSAAVVVTEEPPPEEEKKMEVMDSAANTSNAEAVSPPKVWSKGVKIVRSLLCMDESACIRHVDHSLLPSLGTSLSSCDFIDAIAAGEQQEEQDRRRSVSDADCHTISTTSSSAIHYTIKRPFHSTVLKARYLTNTSVDATKKVVEEFVTNASVSDDQLMRAMKQVEHEFPLMGDDKTIVERNGKRVLEMTLSLPDDYTLEYAPGDSLGLIVGNTPDAVQFVLSILREKHGVLPEQKVSIDYADHPVTVEEAVRDHIDLCSPIKNNRRILHSLSQYATNEEEAACLRLMASKTSEGQKLLETYIDQQRLSVVDILKEFPSTQSIPLKGLLSILPGIPPRYYSVSSSPLDHKRLSLTVAFSVVDYVTPSLQIGNVEEGTRRIGGIATRYLEILCAPHLLTNDKNNNTNGDNLIVSSLSTTTLKIFPKPTNDFHMPATLNTPMILIGPGTGIAPFMGFLYHRRALISSMESTQDASTVVEGTWRGDYDFEENEISVTKGDASGLKLGVDYRAKLLASGGDGSGDGSVDLFFGCRHEDHDWLYKQDMLEMKEQGIITNLNNAFSRDGNNTIRYVQDILRSDATARKRVVDLLMDQKASLYICGDGNAMAKDVQSAVQEILCDRLDGGMDEAKKYVDQLKSEKRWLLDIWTS